MKYSIFKKHPSDFIYIHFIFTVTFKIFISTLIVVLKYSSKTANQPHGILVCFSFGKQDPRVLVQQTYWFPITLMKGKSVSRLSSWFQEDNSLAFITVGENSFL